MHTNTCFPRSEEVCQRTVPGCALYKKQSSSAINTLVILTLPFQLTATLPYSSPCMQPSSSKPEEITKSLSFCTLHFRPTKKNCQTEVCVAKVICSVGCFLSPPGPEHTRTEVESHRAKGGAGSCRAAHPLCRGWSEKHVSDRKPTELFLV